MFTSALVYIKQPIPKREGTNALVTFDRIKCSITLAGMKKIDVRLKLSRGYLIKIINLQMTDAKEVRKML